MAFDPAQTDPIATPRRLYGRLDTEGKIVHTPILTCASRTDTVRIIIDRIRVLPIVFVPGTMGSNLKVKGRERQAWRFDTTVSIALDKIFQDEGTRQRLLHPDRTEVDPDGAVPQHPVGVLHKEQHFRSRGWGEVSADSYLDLLVWLEENLNGQRGQGIGDSPHAQLNARLRAISEGRGWNPQKTFEPLTAAECEKAERWSYPVYACGYNWLQSNEQGAQRLADRIEEIVGANNGEHGRCEQVIVVTHSMGGLTARRCAQLPGMGMRIAGIVHGVMPAIGASVAYRRCKVGMWDEELLASLVIGRTGRHVTAVFAQSPGALELLPTGEYPMSWLQLRDETNRSSGETPGTFQPYSNLYKERTRWWAVINEDWLTPKNGTPLTWDKYNEALIAAEDLHDNIKKSYHSNTWAFYGEGIASFERITWSYHASFHGQRFETPAEMLNKSRGEARMDGIAPEFLRGPSVAFKKNGFQEEMIYGSYGLAIQSADESGDGTVPVISGKAPLPYVKQIFALPGLMHQPAYASSLAREITAYAIAKISSNIT